MKFRALARRAWQKPLTGKSKDLMSKEVGGGLI